MIRLDQLQESTDLEVLLEPKRKVYHLVMEVNGSMLNFHKALKTSTDIERLANEIFQTKNKIKTIKDNSDSKGIITKIEKLKSMTSLDIDFI